MRCEEARAMVPAYLDGDLGDAAPLEVHLAICADCANVVAGYRSMLADLRALRDRGDLPAMELVDRLLVSIPSPTLRRRVISTVGAHPVLATVASVGGAAAIGAATALVVWRHRSVAAAT
jgi:hypothetical protein